MKLSTALQLALLVGASIYLGMAVTFDSWNGMVYFYPGEGERQPAGIARLYDYSHLHGRALELASQERILSAAKIINQTESVGIRLGHFVTKTGENSKDFACNAFKNVEMKFQSADMTVNGDPSIMVVQGNCQSKLDMNHIDPLWIPFAQITEQNPGDMELQFLEDKPVNLSFRNIGDSWPQKWSLDSVRLYGESGHSVQLSRQEIKTILQKPFYLYWGREPASVE